MDNQRLLLFFSVLFVVILLWEAWQEDYVTPSQAKQEAAMVAQKAEEQAQDIPVVENTNIDSVANNPSMAAADMPVQSGPELLDKGQRITVRTGTLDVVIDTLGGDIRDVDLLDYPISANEPDKPFQLLKDRLPNLFVAQTGLLSSDEGRAPDHTKQWKAEKLDYVMSPGQRELRIPLVWHSGDGITVTKVFIFREDSHVIDIEHKVENNSQSNWTGRQYRQLQRSRPDGSNESAFIYTYTGGVIYSEAEKYEKIDFDDMEDSNLAREVQGGWVAMIQHYFLAAIIPAQDEKNNFYTKATADDRYVLGMYSPSKTVAVGQIDTFVAQIYAGPKEQAILEELAEGLELTVDYGFLTVIAKPLFWALGVIYSVVANWGWAIILVTLCIKLVFYPLSAASYRSMANMRRLAPKMKQLKERYGDDRQRMSKAMMDMYKTEKINPMGGCLPMLVQIPVFIALYWVLLESVELRQAPFIFWITDLSIKDPYYVLPVIMGLGMFVQQKLNPAPPDPVQAKIMMALPVVFTLFFAFFPAGLVLYWVANSLLSIAQQWYITRKIDAAAELAASTRK